MEVREIPIEKIKNINELSDEERRRIATNFKDYSESQKKPQVSTPEAEKYYVILLSCSSNGSDKEFLERLIGKETFKDIFTNSIVCQNRDNAYNVAKTLIETDVDGDIDVDDSKVLVDVVPIKQAVSLYRFMKHCEDLYPDDDFRIDDYFREDTLEDDQPPATGNGFNTIYTKEG